ncbi:RNA polymerase sigma factor [Phytohabitans houttuyneae]|nr:sigma-70 family RNA polymerase sigma factor [Phytohabitans houttuyneae]
MLDGAEAEDVPDRLAPLIERLATQDLDAATAQELTNAVHQAVHPLCLSILASVEAAYEAEQETWRRLLEHLRRRDPAAGPIVNGTAYIRKITRNVCHDLGRGISDRRREVPVVDHLGHARALRVETHHDDTTVVPGGADPAAAAFGYRSRRVLEELAGLSHQERMVLCLRQQGRSYGEVAQVLGGGLSAATAQTQGERAMHHLRGRAHVTVWLQEPTTAWTSPPCPRLAELKAEVWQRVSAGAEVTTTLYREIGKHLDPSPNRTGGRDGACRICDPERKRSEVIYWWLIVTLPPLLALPQVPMPEPTARHRHEEPADGGRDRRPRRRRRRGKLRPRIAGLVAAVAVVAVAAVVLAAGLDVPPFGTRGQPRTAAGEVGATGAGPAAAPAALALPQPCALVTPGEVASATGWPANPCTPFAGTTDDAILQRPGVRGYFAPDVGRLEINALFLTAFDLGAQPEAAFADMRGKLQAAYPSGTGGISSGTVPGLGDENVFVRIVYEDGRDHMSTLLLRRANIALELQMIAGGAAGAALEACTALAPAAVGRIG